MVLGEGGTTQSAVGRAASASQSIVAGVPCEQGLESRRWVSAGECLSPQIVAAPAAVMAQEAWEASARMRQVAEWAMVACAAAMVGMAVMMVARP